MAADGARGRRSLRPEVPVHLLDLSDGFPYPLTSGRLRQYFFLQELGRRHRVTLIAAVPPGDRRVHAEALAGVVDRLEFVETERLDPSPGAKLVSRLRPGGDLAVAQRLLELHATDPFDVILNGRVPIPFRRVVPGVPIVTDICDAVPDRLRERLRHAKRSNAPMVVAKYVDARRFEDRLVAEADTILFASARDRDTLVGRGRPLPRTEVVPNGVDSDAWRRQSAERPRDVIVFAGAMPFAPNDDAARFLIEGILPIVRRSRPGARLRIVGRDPGPRLLAAARGVDGVEVTGFVEDMRAELETATVVVAPMRFGAGIQNKLLEAMAMAIPVITTSVAYDGLVRPGEPLPPVTVADGAEAIGAAPVRGLVAADLDPTPDHAARAWVVERFSWADIGARLDAIVAEAVASGGSAASR